MTQWEYTYLWWEGSTTSVTNGQLGKTTPPIGEEIRIALGLMESPLFPGNHSHR